MSELTICTVNYKSGGLIDANWRLTALLNREPAARWIVVENTAAGEPRRLDPSDDRFQIIPSQPVTDPLAFHPDCLGGIKLSSYQHGQNLNLALRHVRTRYALCLDPDFFILMPGWCSRVPHYMGHNALAFFGAPHHPRLWTKYRYFPGAFCIFIDLDRVPRESLDFRPVMRPRNWLIRTIEKRFRRALVVRAPDTGWRVHARYAGHRAYPVELTRVRWSPPPSDGRLREWARALVPDSLLMGPKDRGYTVPCTLASFGYPDPGALGELVDEYFWHDQPFGIHVRYRVQKADDAKLSSFLLALSAGAGSRPLTPVAPEVKAAC